MLKYQEKKIGSRTTPEIEGETDFFIHLGLILLEFEECSDHEDGIVPIMKNYRQEMQN
ncbi:MAG: hypothetical protein KGD64_13685 [Candidatus Heimdallarchaeota archaeon]|nr:hypothetical protein [Candidatus Heimdallarchaeota archaeon]